ncbi:FlgD immunoglobulin-like domain containing protein, partial [Fibrobacterota bacterium]
IQYTLPYRWEDNGWLNTNCYKVKMVIYDARGRVVRELVNRKQKPGHYRVVWRGKSDTGRRVASGFYFCRLEAGKYSSVRKIIAIR